MNRRRQARDTALLLQTALCVVLFVVIGGLRHDVATAVASLLIGTPLAWLVIYWATGGQANYWAWWREWVAEMRAGRRPGSRRRW